MNGDMVHLTENINPLNDSARRKKRESIILSNLDGLLIKRNILRSIILSNVTKFHI
jgi:hypothetical protein